MAVEYNLLRILRGRAVVYLDSLLKDAKLSKQQLANNLGITIKAIYTWKGIPPRYASAYLEQYIENRELKQGKKWLMRYLGL